MHLEISVSLRIASPKNVGKEKDHKFTALVADRSKHCRRNEKFDLTREFRIIMLISIIR